MLVVGSASILIVHPLSQFPGGPVYVQALLHHIYMEAQGRSSWRLSKKRDLSPVGGDPWREWREKEKRERERVKREVGMVEEEGTEVA